MKILVFGATGKIGREVVNLLKPEHDVIGISSRSGPIIADYTDATAVESVFQQVTDVDAVVVAVGGDSNFKPYSTLNDVDILLGAQRKLIAQFRIVALAQKYLNQGGSVTLTSGFLSHYPNEYSLATGPFNAAIDTYVSQSAPLLKNDMRLNVVSPAPVVEQDKVRTGLVTARDVALYYIDSILGMDTGKVYRAWGGLPLPEQA
ncbi:NAD-dependent epimerase/dehydratase family protein [Shewanella gelidimarina]|uniref:NAD-dependent epimerase/dehydratase family protein n=1 Tax=Shewanella gelidimarina TaxID=56813 RepID=UPI00200D3218|nr:NAD-dependent epimerase/dehydratase family protein [Shewanella gelidimarina]MCL1057502.1 NAD-dependent epimerase/dehydratase family protein [Shewanella gelidimarina]